MTTKPEAIEQLRTIDGPDDDRADDEWLAEVNRRAERIRRGEASGKPWPIVRDELLARLRQYDAASSDAQPPVLPEVE